MTKETPLKVSWTLTVDMVFEEDQILLSFFEKYEADEEDLLKQDVIKYVGTGHFGEKITEEMTTGESLEDVSGQLANFEADNTYLILDVKSPGLVG